MPIILTEAERATAREIAKAITNEHLETVLEILRGQITNGQYVLETAETTPIVEFAIRAYERAFADVAAQIEHKRL